MPQPPAYAVTTDFSVWQSSNPTTPLQGTSIDTEFDNLATTIAAIRTNMALLQRDDGEQANASIVQDQLKTEIYAGINSPTAWAATTAYTKRDSVIDGTKWYYCNTAHTSGASLSADASKWTEIFDFADLNAQASVKLAQSVADTSPDYFDEIFATLSMIQTTIDTPAGDEKSRAGLVPTPSAASTSAGTPDVINSFIAVDTTAAVRTRFLPSSPSDKDTVWFCDHKGTFDSNKLTINGNGKNIQFRNLSAAATLDSSSKGILICCTFSTADDQWNAQGWAG